MNYDAILVVSFGGPESHADVIPQKHRSGPTDSLSATFYGRTINSETGEWGPSSAFYSFDDNTAGINSDEVRLSSRSINDLNLLNTQTPVRIYPPAGGKTPLIDCTSTMLAACGQASRF